MDKLTQLWIRACKSREPIKRCQSLYRRFYFGNGELTQSCRVNISRILVDIVQEYTDTSIVTVIDGLNPNRFFALPDDRSHHERVMDFLVGRIAVTPAKNFVGLGRPTRLKNRVERAFSNETA